MKKSTNKRKETQRIERKNEKKNSISQISTMHKAFQNDHLKYNADSKLSRTPVECEEDFIECDTHLQRKQNY